MHEINFIDKSFDQYAIDNYSISIQANQNGLAYCIADERTNTYVLFRKHRFDKIVLPGDLLLSIAGVFKSDETISLPFHRVRFMGYTRQTTLVPDEYFDSSQIGDYIRFNHAGEVDHELFNNLVTPPGIHNIFAFPQELVSLITSHFKKVEFMNQTTPFLRHIANLPDPFSVPSVFLGLHTDFFDIACVGDGKLKLYNTFQYANENDLLYYIVFVYNQAGFDTLKIPLLLSGELSSKLSYFDLIKQYIPETRYDEAFCIPTLAPGLKQLGTARFLNLLNLQMCGSSAEHIVAEK